MEKDVDGVRWMGKLDFVLISAHSQVCRREKRTHENEHGIPLHLF